jgi:hypothetical protein
MEAPASRTLVKVRALARLCVRLTIMTHAPQYSRQKPDQPSLAQINAPQLCSLRRQHVLLLK